MAANVLVVDDDPNLVRLMSKFLKLEGFSPVPAANGEEALSYLRGGGDACVILLDLRMPVMDGWRRSGASSAAIPGSPTFRSSSCRASRAIVFRNWKPRRRSINRSDFRKWSAWFGVCARFVAERVPQILQHRSKVVHDLATRTHVLQQRRDRAIHRLETIAGDREGALSGRDLQLQVLS